MSESSLAGLIHGPFPMSPPETGSRSYCSTLKKEYQGRIIVNDKSVFRRLGCDDLSAVIVGACVVAVQGDLAVMAAHRQLEKLVDWLYI